MDVTKRLAVIVDQERELVLAAFDEHTAWTIGNRIHEEAVTRRLAIAIDLRFFDRPLFFSALPGTAPDKAEWIRRKANVVQRFHRSSYAMGLEMVLKQSSLYERYG